ncbi:MAG: ribonuclease HI family protein [Patescibacteria group bacterium]
MNIEKLIIFTDGGARGNPGPSGIGAVLYDTSHNLIAEISEYLGVATNNQAEYKALIAALKKAAQLSAQELECYLDSELVVKQLKREYKVKNKDLAPLFLEIHNLSLNFKKINYTHIPREKNTEADRLANEAMDRGR